MDAASVTTIMIITRVPFLFNPLGTCCRTPNHERAVDNQHPLASFHGPSLDLLSP